MYEDEIKMSKISKEEKIHDLAVIFVKRECKKRKDETIPWQKEIENILDDYAKSVEFIETCWNRHVSD